MEINVLIPGTIDAEGLLYLLFNPHAIPDDVFVDMHDGRLMPARKFFGECHGAITGDMRQTGGKRETDETNLGLT